MKNLPLSVTALCTLGLLAGLPTPDLTATPLVNAAAKSSDEQVRITLYEQASPAVVTVKTAQGAGSGSIITTGGLVLTNEHVVRRANRGRVEIATSTGDRHLGQVIAIDRPQDLALVQILSSERFPTIPLGDRARIRVGQQVYAIGSPFGLSGTLTTGILSRIAPNGDLQTDAAINQGNSGGPLLNSQGQLIGVNKAIVTPSRGNVGIGFATPATAVQTFIARNQAAIAQAATIARQPQPQPPQQPRPQPQASREPARLGVDITADLIIRGVERGSVAHRVGLQPGDRIVAINRQRLRSVRDLLAFMEDRPQQALFTIARYRRLATVQIDFTNP